MRRKFAIATLALAMVLALGALAGCSGGQQSGADDSSAAPAAEEPAAPAAEPAADAAAPSADVTIPDEVFAAGCEVQMDDGAYAMSIEFAGGSGKASIASPATVVVKGGKAAAQVVWSSPNYDYMIVNGVKYNQVNTDGGNSVFQIPVTAFDEPMEVVGDTTAMSQPHEIDYTITFVSKSVTGL